MTRPGKKTLHSCGLRRSLLACAAAVVACFATEARAETINLSGVVPAKSGVRLVQRQSVLPADLRQPLHDFVLFSLVLQTNNNLRYTLTVLSESARENGSAALVDQQTGSAIPYTLALGSQEVRFQDGKAVLETGSQTNKSGKSEDLKISTRPGSTMAAGQYEEHLTLVMSIN
ncbi:MAG: hypothetical protein ACM30I_07240 [Gemmatimonas sp.]